YAEALSDYHLHPEAKFLNGDYLDHGSTMRRDIHLAGVRYIGKEANRWEEQFYLGSIPKRRSNMTADRRRLSNSAVEFTTLPLHLANVDWPKRPGSRGSSCERS